MPRHPIELARKHYEQLPSILKEALFSTDVAEQMTEIGKKFGLTIEKTGIMAEETGYVMLGLARPNEFTGNLAHGLQINKDKATDIAAEINHQIFFPLREELKRTHDFDMEMGREAGLSDAMRVSGMQMPASVKLSTGSSLIPSGVEAIKKTFIEEKSSLVDDLTRIREQTSQLPPKPISPIPPEAAPKPIQPPLISARPPSFVLPAAPTGRITDLKEMIKAPSMAVSPAVVAPLAPMIPQVVPTPTPPISVPPPPIVSPTSIVPKPVSPTTQKTAPEPFASPRRNMTDLLLPRTTPQLHDWSGFGDLDKDETILEMNMKKELRETPAPTDKIPPASVQVDAANTSTSSDPYREPVEEE